MFLCLWRRCGGRRFKLTAVFNVLTRQLRADMDFRYEHLNGPGQLPTLQPQWTWATNALVIDAQEDGRAIIPISAMQ